MKTTWKRRTTIRIISFLSALFVLVAGLAISGWNRSIYYQTGLEYSYQRALSDLGSYLNSIDISLKKGLYAGTSNQLDSISMLLWKDCSGAKSCLASLPVGALELDKTQKFIAQVGDFSLSLARKVRQGNSVTDEDRKTFEMLRKYADELAEHVANMQEYVQGGKLQIGQVQEVLENEQEPSEEPSVNNGFLQMEEGFTDFPSLIYDGPYSDHVAQQEPKWLKDKALITQPEALEIAKSFTGENSLEAAGEEGGNMAAWCFKNDTVSIAVTKQGGFVSYFLRTEQQTAETVSQEDCVKIAREFLEKNNIAPLKETYYYSSAGVCTVNFAYMDENTLCYPDLVKVGVSVDSGNVVVFDARGYLMNHTQRTLPEVKVSEAEAKTRISPVLTVKTSRMTMIPMPDSSESYCYEFSCMGQEEEEVLVYVNANTGVEEQILILLKMDGGTLSM